MASDYGDEAGSKMIDDFMRFGERMGERAMYARAAQMQRTYQSRFPSTPMRRASSATPMPRSCRFDSMRRAAFWLSVTSMGRDEFDLWQQAAAALPGMFEQSLAMPSFELEILESPDTLTDLVDLLVPAVLIVAMFMGCTFNAMNVIAEKEEGVSFINEVLPMTPGQYVRQKIAVGFLWGALSSLISAAICLHVPLPEAGLLFMWLVFGGWFWFNSSLN